MADTKQQWYKDAKYGLFIHWGLYSILAGEWKDPKTGEVTKTDRIAEWIENNLNIDKEDYRKLKDEFHPDKFDADMFVKRAKEQWGVKYIVLTSKHHEGFAMYDSKVSDSGPLYTDPDQQHCNSIKRKEQPVLPDPDLCCVWYVPGDIPLYRIHGWNLQEPG